LISSMTLASVNVGRYRRSDSSTLLPAALPMNPSHL
jgi:hypothetical protein